MDIAILIKHSGFERPEDLNFETREELARLFGVSHRLFKPKISRWYSKNQIAEILVKYNLVKDLEEGIKETESLVKKEIGEFDFVKGINKDGETAYRLEHVGDRKWHD